MKKFKLFLLMFVAAASVCGFTSCKDDDDKGAGSIVGSWILREPDGYDRYVFHADGAYINEWSDYEYGPDSDRGTYTYNGRELTLISYEDGRPDTYLATISGNRLTLDLGKDGYLVYTRE